MTDSEKLDLLLQKVIALDEKVSGLDEKVSGLDEKVSGLDEKVSVLDEKVSVLEKDMIEVKAEITILHRDDALILDEIERVHEILNRHKSDKKVHTA